MIRPVLDTNVWISAFLNPHGPPGVLRGAIRSGAVEVCWSEKLIAGLEDVLTRPKILALGVELTEVREFLDLVRTTGVGVKLDSIPSVVALDPDDDAILATATGGAADVIIPGDRHLLDLGAVSGIPILTPRQALELLQQ